MEEEEAEAELSSSVFVDLRHVACGLAHTLTVDAEGNVWSLGSNFNGQLGIVTKEYDCSAPQRVELDVFVVSVACGFFHSGCVDTQNRLWTFGSNNLGQLGVGDKNNRRKPTLVDNLPVATISCGANHTVCIDPSGDVWSFGSNEKGQLGLGDSRNRTHPSNISSLHNVISVTTGYAHSVFLTEAKQCFIAGAKLFKSGKAKKPMLIRNIGNVTAIASLQYLVLMLTEEKEIYGIGESKHSQSRVGILRKISPRKLFWNEGEA